MKKVVFLISQSAILLLAHFLVWGDTIIILGIAAIIIQCVLNLKFVGWVAAFAYPLTYVIASLCDTPVNGAPNNLYVYWYLSYIVITVVAFITDLILKKQKKSEVESNIIQASVQS